MPDSLTKDCHFIDTDKQTITLTTDDGADLLCSIVRIFHTPGQDYIVLIPEDGSSDGQGFLFRFALNKDGSPDLSNIPTDEEYSHASAVFDELQNEAGKDVYFEE